MFFSRFQRRFPRHTLHCSATSTLEDIQRLGMASHSRSSSFSSSTSDRPPVPATIRLQRAMEAHAALQLKASRRIPREPPSPHLEATSTEGNARSSACTISAASVDDLAEQLRQLWQREKNRDESRVDSEDSNPPPSLPAALQKIGSNEKNELLLYMLEQQDSLRSQRSEAAALGEKIAAQLVHQQHELRQTYREQINKLEEQLHQAVHCNPAVAALQAKVEQLEESNREHEQKLRFAVQKLQRSRKREKELKMMNDPLWD